MYKALKSFCGKVSMKKGEIKPIDDVNIANDLLFAGYIEEIKPVEIKKTVTEVKTEVKEKEVEVKKTKTSKKKK